MSLRDKIVKPFGLRGSAVREPGEVVPGARLGPMRVIDVSADEVVAGKDDEHLSYRVIFVVRDGAHGAEGACSTVVRYNQPSGKPSPSSARSTTRSWPVSPGAAVPPWPDPALACARPAAALTWGDGRLLPSASP